MKIENIIKHPAKQKNSEIKEWISALFIAVIIAVIVKLFILDIVVVSGVSMLPTLHGGDRLIVEKVSTEMHDIKRESIYIVDPDKNMKLGELIVKRAIAIGGDKLIIKNGQVYVNGQKVNEKYLPSNIVTSSNINMTVPKGYVFFMGDNRDNSVDSRVFGPVPINEVKAHVVMRIYPFNRISLTNVANNK